MTPQPTPGQFDQFRVVRVFLLIGYGALLVLLGGRLDNLPCYCGGGDGNPSGVAGWGGSGIRQRVFGHGRHWPVEYLNKTLIERFDGSEWPVVLFPNQISLRVLFAAWFPSLGPGGTPGYSEICVMSVLGRCGGGQRP